MNPSDRSTDPDAMMELHLSFATERCSRTIIVPAVPLHIATLIADLVRVGGHAAEFKDAMPAQRSLSARLGAYQKRLARAREKAENVQQNVQTGDVVPFDSVWGKRHG